MKIYLKKYHQIYKLKLYYFISFFVINIIFLKILKVILLKNNEIFNFFITIHLFINFR